MSEFSMTLVHRLDTPRALRRYIGQIEAFLPAVRAEVDWVDFCYLSWLRTFEPGFYGLIQRERLFLLGEGHEFMYTNADAVDKKLAKLEGLFVRAGVAAHNKLDVLKVLGELFPSIKLIEKGKPVRNLPEAKAKRIAHADYFDRYFQFGVSSDDIPDSVVVRALESISTFVENDDVAKLQTHVTEDSVRTIRKIEALRSDDAGSSTALAIWLSKFYGDLASSSAWFWSPTDYVENLFANCLADLSAAEAIPIVLQCALQIGGGRLAADAVALLAGREFGGQEEIKRWRDLGIALTPALSEVAGAEFEKYPSPTKVFEIPDETWAIFYRWTHFDAVGARQYLQSRIDKGEWSLLDVLARLVTVAIPVGVPGALGHIQAFDDIFVGRFLDLDKATAELQNEIDIASDLPDLYEIEATIENRRSKALVALRDRKFRASQG